MTFLIFKEPVNKKESLTAGKIYLGSPGMEDSDVVALDLFRIESDNGQVTSVSRNDGRWGFLSSVYAVVVRQFGGYRPGEVVVLRDVTPDGKFAVVADSTDCQSLDSFEILDSRIMAPGIVVMKKKTGFWKRVVVVNESQWMSTSALDALCPPTDYLFAVSGGLDGSKGDLLSQPMVRCLVAGNDVAEGRWYNVEQSVGQFYIIKGDSGTCRRYLASRFKM
jgi:hypothetical protein